MSEEGSVRFLEVSFEDMDVPLVQSRESFGVFDNSDNDNEAVSPPANCNPNMILAGSKNNSASKKVSPRVPPLLLTQMSADFNGNIMGMG